MIEADLLSGELGGRPPHIRVPESLAPIAVDRVAHHADVGILLHDHRIRHVRVLPLRLQEDAHEPEGRIDLVLQAREADALLRGNRDELPSRQLRLELLHVVRGDEVDLVHDDERPQEDTVPREDVDQLVFRDVLPRPRPFEAPRMSPGMSSTWIFAPRCSMRPGMTSSVVKSYAATSLVASVI